MIIGVDQVIKKWLHKLQRIWVGALVVSCTVGMMGCSGTEVKEVTIGNQFNLNQVSLTLLQSVTPNIVYYSEPELQSLLTKHLRKHLTLQGKFSTNSSVNRLNIKVNYKRHFLGEQSTTPSESLAYPNYDFEISVVNGRHPEQVLTRIVEKNRVFKGRFIMNIDVQAGRLDKKSDEVAFIDGIAKAIARSL